MSFQVSSTLFTKVMALHYQGDDLLEQGVLAELSGKPKPTLFHQALGRFEETSAAMAKLDSEFGELIDIHNRGRLVPLFESSLHKLRAESSPIERVSMAGKRYSNVAGSEPSSKNPPALDLLGIMQDQRADLRILKHQMDETIAAFRVEIPRAEKGEFAAHILSGRQGFSDKIQQSVSMIGIFGRSYTSECAATIDATMQIYPSGLEWLKDSGRSAK